MANFSGPYQIRIFYTVAGRDHRQSINCDVQGSPVVGSDFSTITLETKDSVGVAADTAIDAWIDVIDGRFNLTDAVFNRAELWKYVPLSEDASYVATYAIGAAGNTAGATVPAGEIIMTFRTQEGGIMKVSFQDTSMPAGSSQAYPPTDGGDEDIMDYVVADDTWMLAKDTSYPIVPLALHPGQNERAFKKIYRS